MDIATLATRLHQLIDELPQAGLAAADEHLETAYCELTEAARESSHDPGLTSLSQSRHHLDAGRRKLVETVQSIEEYLAAIGVGIAATAPAQTAKRQDASDQVAPDPDAWWLDRVSELCQRKGRPNPHNLTPTRLVNELTYSAVDVNAGRYWQQLRDTRPATAAKLPALTWPTVRSLTEDRLGGAPNDKQLKELAKRTHSPLKSLLPGVELDDVHTSLARACNHVDESTASDPATHAVLGPALIAELHRLTAATR
ncbi:hypothetical protein [Haloglycomyces albus]|uniref:hypothetical protein n=1 Tax=Haloglycomyces albus TaxID=526067 RepID=UPI00046D73ED|nr:hypothetical protein [Haloglycomyces albus]